MIALRVNVDRRQDEAGQRPSRNTEIVEQTEAHSSKSVVVRRCHISVADKIVLGNASASSAVGVDEQIASSCVIVCLIERDISIQQVLACCTGNSASGSRSSVYDQIFFEDKTVDVGVELKKLKNSSA